MPYGIRHTKKTYLVPRGIKKSKFRFSQRGKKNVFSNRKEGMSSVPELDEGMNDLMNPKDESMK